MIATWYAGNVIFNTALVECSFLLAHVKAALSMMLYAKMSTMNLCSFRSSNTGKFINLLVNDLSVFEMRIFNFLIALSFPLMLIGIVILLMMRVGWVGILGVIIFSLFLPVSVCISNKNGDIISDSN